MQATQTNFYKIAASAVMTVVYYRWRLVKALAIPFSIYVLLDLLTYLNSSAFGTLILWVLNGAVYSVFAITTHRMVLLGADAVPEWGITRWSRRETSFALHLIGVSLLAIPASLPAVIPYVGVVITIVLLCWLMGRLSLVFPGIAVDDEFSFGKSWELTEDHQLLMFLVVVVFPLIVAVPVILLAFIPYTTLLTSLLSTLLVVFEVAALSMAFKLITELPSEEPGHEEE